MAKEILYRSSTIERHENIDEEARTIGLSFSSEAPVERVFGNEALDCRVYNVAALEILNPNFEKMAKNLKVEAEEKPAEEKGPLPKNV